MTELSEEELFFDSENVKPKSIKTVGIVTIIVSAIMILSYGLAAISYSMVSSLSRFGGKVGSRLGADTDLGSIMGNSAYAIPLSLLIMVLAIVLLVGAVNFRKYKKWGQMLSTGICAAIVVSLIIMMIVAAPDFDALLGQTGDEFVDAISSDLSGMSKNNYYGSYIVWTLPFIALAIYLNHPKVSPHFDQ